MEIKLNHLIKTLRLPIKNSQSLKQRIIYFNLSPKDKFDKKDIIKILTELNFPYSKP